MGKNTYTPAEAWAIFAGGLIIGLVLTSFFWAYVTTPKEAKEIQKEAEGEESLELTKPVEFIKFCESIDGEVEWDSEGYRSCAMESTDEKEVVVMSVFCKKFDLNLSYGSYGVKCDGKVSLDEE